ncbi:uncharacterized protein [Amphiura filiformis]|uniref:uncharacterized protein n=1 Tax=Amphiura filiformis TaxID=82378 RepID=UPI003B218E12
MRNIIKIISAILLLKFLSIKYGVSASRTPNILLVGKHTKSGTGALLLLLDGKWKLVCRKGNDRKDQTWSTKEATVACRQLGYQGGWATELDYNPMANIRNVPLQLVDDFRCLGGERSLNDCYHDSHYYQRDRLGCGPNNFAGVQCFDSFEVRLVGGAKPNTGRVQIQYDDNEWTDVCYNSKKKSRLSPAWGFHEVQVVCRELGYPGALMKQRGGYGNAEGQAFVNGFNCLGNEKRLTDCLSSVTEKSTQRHKYSCGARNEAVAICADPGYAGCFYYTDFQRGDKTLLDTTDSHEMTVRMCREHCRLKQSYKFAALYDGNTCMCGRQDLLTSIKRSPDSKCRNPCAGNDHEICGGYHFISVYDVDIGVCVDPYNQSNSYYYGDVVGDVQCPDAEHVVYGSPEVQCIMGDSMNETRWSGPFPHCQAQLEEKKTSRFTITVLWVAIGFFCLLAAAFIAAAEFTIRRTCYQPKKMLKSAKSLTINLPPKRKPKSIGSQLISIRNSIRDSIKVPFADHFYETTLRPRTSMMLNLCSTKLKYERTPDLLQEDTFRDPLPISVKYQKTGDLPQEDNYEISRDILSIPKLKCGSARTRELPTRNNYETLCDPSPITRLKCGSARTARNDDHLKVLNPSKLTEDKFKGNNQRRNSHRTHNQRRALFRNSDDDVAAYIVRTKL